MLRHLREALKPGGRLVLLEYRKEDPSIPIQPRAQDDGRRSQDRSRSRRLHAAKVDEALPRQHILIFTVRAVARPSASASAQPRALHRTHVPLPLPAGPARRSIFLQAGSREHARATRNWLLLVASVIFYAKGGGAFTWLMLARSPSTTGWRSPSIARAARRRARAAAARPAAVAVNLVVLGVFKYANFFADNVNALLGALGVAAARRAASAAADRHLVLHVPRDLVRRRRLPARRDGAEEPGARGALPAALSAAHRRPDHPLPRHRRPARAARRHARRLRLRRPPLRHRPRQEGADRQHRRRAGRQDLRDAAGRAHRRPTPGSAIVCYTLQIYFDFSGYSDMAIGLGRMFGFRFPENFRWPYIADIVQEFWRRWHISLSTWFRDYLYVPLGGNRVGAGADVRQSRHRVLPVRPVARRELELRRLGPVPRHVPRHRAVALVSRDADGSSPRSRRTLRSGRASRGRSSGTPMCWSSSWSAGCSSAPTRCPAPSAS